MAPRNSPTVWRRWLAAELKARREALGLNQKEVANGCGWSGARLSYLEKGQQVPTEDDLDRLLPIYDVGPDDVPRFHEAVKYAREKGWWERVDERDIPEYLRNFIGLEQGASLIRTVEPLIVPGLLQTRDYIVTKLRDDITDRTERLIAQIADLRLRRQRVLTHEAPAELDAVIDESVLRRTVGGPTVMAAQLQHLVTMAERPNVRLRVFPFDRGVHEGMAGPYRLLSFDDDQPAVLYIEHRKGGDIHEDPVKVDEHILAFSYLVEAAWSLDESAAFIKEMASDYATRVSR